MIDCMIIGDSIGVGTSMFRKDCVSYSISGYNSWQWNKKFSYLDITANTVIISLGSNDHKSIHTHDELVVIRSRTHATKVYWIRPAIKPNIQEIVELMAHQYGDTVVPITSLQPDGIHPSWKGYKQIASDTK